MTVYSVYARQSDAPLAVADRFSWSAALVPPIHALVHGLWAMLALWVVKVLALVAAGFWVGGGASFWLYVLLAVWFGFSAAGFRRRKADKPGAYRGDWIAPDETTALMTYLGGRPAP